MSWIFQLHLHLSKNVVEKMLLEIDATRIPVVDVAIGLIHATIGFELHEPSLVKPFLYFSNSLKSKRNQQIKQ
jgi:hypothetical protein